ncbi:hypothetical protein PV08_04406 [Exophiala spinifera]|uniref:GAR domain-containing protein n=1 Tax=Exophiala spinifera TaxID=91928 RepID=A0A0D2BF11_9EURO|nr:uncharacterized protein PV08_04406 [Exophiala spinifera]KIW17215.1 hypothetical protein PV08_04406 [Exophiala spinifera]
MSLTTPTKPKFPLFERPGDSRSPSRSPRKKPQFAIRELDPLLANLSPDSTLRALRATDTIPGGGSQDALASSIGDASPAEREVGIRAAFAAQKLREWRDEVSKWTWPGTRERALGLGFITPRGAQGFNLDYRGFLTVTLAEHYEARIEEIRDGLDTLGIEDIKDHVLEAHVPAKASPMSPPSSGSRTSYGRMRDFTALVTATVIQALPDLAKLNMLLDNWDIRLRVLRQLPRFYEVMDSTTSEVQQAFDEIQNTDAAAKLTEDMIERKKVVVGAQVAELGRRVDRLLDMLEGHDDSLPQTWIDRLEKIELDYATWVVEAQQVVLRNSLGMTLGKSPRQGQLAPKMTLPGLDSETAPSPREQHTDGAETRPEVVEELRTINTESSSPSKGDRSVKHKPSLKLNLSADRNGHRREISKVSIADSTISGFSDLSNAEIMDARQTSVLPSPKINLVDNPFRASRDELTWFGNSTAAQQELAFRPPMLQRASTASVEVVPKDQLKRVVLRRSASWDMLSAMPESPESTPSKALRQLTGADSPLKDTAVAELEGSEVVLDPPTASTSEGNSLASPSLEVEPLQLKTKEAPPGPPIMPALPRRSSKRNTQDRLSTFSTLTPISSNSPVTPVDNVQTLSDSTLTTSIKETSPNSAKKVESLEDKIQDILTTLPTKIRLAKDGDYSGITQPSSTSSTRSSTPTAALTLSPVKAETYTPKSDDSGIRLYHLTRSGQARDAPPVKLFVRSVGDGQRVMVRVGGGWADLGEYLKEYSLHHGSRSTADGRLEVASFPSNGLRDANAAHNTQGSLAKRKSKSPASSPQTADISSPPDLSNPRLRPLTRVRSPEPERRVVKDKESWTPPPVPPIPSSYYSKSPTTTTAANRDSGAPTVAIGPAQSPDGKGTGPSSRTTTIQAPGVTTTTTVTPATTTATNYTPLGGAGPKTNPRRAAAFATGSAADNDAWVENLVGKARAVSGGNATNIGQGPSMTTTTTTTTTTSLATSSNNTPTTRRASSYMSLTPNSSPVTLSPSPSNSSAASSSDSKSRRVSLTGRSKSRMSLSDMSGIRRVFLRKKSENVR